ncbi:MAG TPA: hypothetical protein VG028_06860 [Terriglobia bacterium]|nr:hypothetical protein [Terriglobia bacterium]
MASAHGGQRGRATRRGAPTQTHGNRFQGAGRVPTEGVELRMDGQIRTVTPKGAAPHLATGAK